MLPQQKRTLATSLRLALTPTCSHTKKDSGQCVGPEAEGGHFRPLWAWGRQVRGGKTVTPLGYPRPPRGRRPDSTPKLESREVTPSPAAPSHTPKASEASKDDRGLSGPAQEKTAQKIKVKPLPLLIQAVSISLL